MAGGKIVSPYVKGEGPRRPEEGISFITGEDDGEWIDWGQPDPVVEPILWLFMQNMDVTLDLTMSSEEAATREEPGLRELRVGEWTVALNYGKRWAQDLPPWHVGVQWKGRTVGILSPVMKARTCPVCKVMGSFTTFEVKDPTGHTARIAAASPRTPCLGRAPTIGEGGIIRPSCGHMDWWGNRIEYGNVVRAQLQLDMAAAVDKGDGGDGDIWEQFAELYDEDAAELAA